MPNSPKVNKTSQDSPQPKTILVVEDNDSYRQLVCASLARALPGCYIIEADSVQSARRAAPVETLHAAVLDMTLPDGMATDIIEGWQSYMNDGLKVLVFSSYEADEVAPALLKMGVHEYVNKERGMRSLIQAIQSVVHGGNGEKDVQTQVSGNNMQSNRLGQS
jgi:DNA-binding NtrC family response regulator